MISSLLHHSVWRTCRVEHCVSATCLSTAATKFAATHLVSPNILCFHFTSVSMGFRSQQSHQSHRSMIRYRNSVFFLHVQCLQSSGGSFAVLELFDKAQILINILANVVVIVKTNVQIYICIRYRSSENICEKT